MRNVCLIRRELRDIATHFEGLFCGGGGEFSRRSHIFCTVARDESKPGCTNHCDKYTFHGKCEYTVEYTAL